MRRVALRGLLARKLRSALTAIAIVLGVAMVSGTLVLTDTIDKAFDSIFSSLVRADRRGRLGQEARRMVADGKAQISPDVLAKVRRCRGRGCRRNDPRPLGRRQPGEDPRPRRQGDPGQQPDLRPRCRAGRRAFQPVQARRGRLGVRPGEVVIDLNTADEQGFRIGDTVKVAGEGPVRPFELVGIARFGDVDSLGGATIALFDVETARTVLGEGRVRRDRRRRPRRRQRERADRRDRHHAARHGRRTHRRAAGGWRTARASASSSSSSATSCSPSAASRSSSARSSSSTRSRSRSRSGRRNWPHCGRSAPHGGRCSARSSSRARSSASSPPPSGSGSESCLRRG